MRYSQIRKMDISNGVGVGVSLFVQGCHFHCKGCFNKETWDFSGGKEWTDDVEEKFFELIDRPYVKRVSFLGGEPLASENVQKVMHLMLQIKEKYPEKKIWLYTGFKWESIISYEHVEGDTPVKKAWRHCCLVLADVVVDGQFQLEHQDILHKEIIWAGSTNQRIIDSKKSVKEGRVVAFEGYE